MKTQKKYVRWVLLVLIGSLAVLSTIFLVLWHQLPPEHQQVLISIGIEHFAYFVVAVFFVLIIVGLGAEWFFHKYIIPVNRIAEETDLICTVNPSLRVSIQGSHDVRRLAGIINQCADRQATLQKSMARELDDAKSLAETERAILATLLANLPQGILVCNLDGNIVFYNHKVKELLMRHRISHEEAPEGAHQWLGLGRSVYAFIDRALIMPALDRISRKFSQGQPSVSERFLLETKTKAILPAEIMAVLDSQHHITGFIIYIEDQQVKLERDQEMTTQLQAWEHQLTQAISVIKSATDIVKDEFNNATEEQQQMVRVLSDGAEMAAKLLMQREVTRKWSPRQPWPLTPISADEWGRFLAHRVNETTGLEFALKTTENCGQISIDMHHLTNAISYICYKIKQATGIENVRMQLYAKESWIYLDLVWHGKAIDNSLLVHWKQDVASVGEIVLTIPVSDILRAHGARLWTYHSDLEDGYAGVRLLLPTIESAEIIKINGHTTILPESRPEFYDFNLFQQTGQSAKVDRRLLSELTYTVFDTETTGLDPKGGDEIISIGAIRIVNGRLLRDEQFSQLINPRRDLPWSSVKYHGIREEMLVDQPFIEQVLPRFRDFVQNTVLVGHNVAFDMRMLQMKEEQTKICFTNPVLDTMLLSDVVHPAQGSHSLSATAERLGVRVVGRHTAMGDAVATADIFLKLLPLLASQGIRTFEDARLASEKTYHARLKY